MCIEAVIGFYRRAAMLRGRVVHCRRVQSRPLHGPQRMGSAAGTRLPTGPCLRMRPHRCGRMLP